MSITIRNKTYVFATYYRFVNIANPQQMSEQLYKCAEDCDISGLIILGEEGINSTIAGSEQSVHKFCQRLASIPEFTNIEFKLSRAELKKPPFKRLKIKIKKEIVTMGIQGIEPEKMRGTYVSPEDWDELLQDPDVMLIDTRNVYEYRIGSFNGAVDPQIHTFRQFPQRMTEIIEKKKPKKIAMFCTGGIRCEKASAFVKSLGVDEVYHLQGGILKYLEQIPAKQSSWSGNCFVFDGRITVAHGLEAEEMPICPTCGQVMTSNLNANSEECVHCLEYPRHTTKDSNR